MSRTCLGCLCLTFTAAAMIGCESTPDSRDAHVAPAAMADLNTETMTVDFAARQTAPYRLGAGDELGQAVFAYYVAAVLEADSDVRFATGQHDAPQR